MHYIQLYWQILSAFKQVLMGKSMRTEYERMFTASQSIMAHILNFFPGQKRIVTDHVSPEKKSGF